MKLFRQRFSATNQNQHQRNTNGGNTADPNSNSTATSTTTPNIPIPTRVASDTDLGPARAAESGEDAAVAPEVDESRPIYVKRGGKLQALPRQRAYGEPNSTPPSSRSAPTSQRSSTEAESHGHGHGQVPGPSHNQVQLPGKNPPVDLRISQSLENGSEKQAAPRVHKLSIQFPIYAPLTPQNERKNAQPTRKISSIECRPPPACTLEVPTSGGKHRSSSFDDSYQGSQSPSDDEECSQAQRKFSYATRTSNNAAATGGAAGGNTGSPSSKISWQLRPFSALKRGATITLPDICIHCVHEQHYQRKLRRQRAASRSESAGSSDDESRANDFGVNFGVEHHSASSCSDSDTEADAYGEQDESEEDGDEYASGSETTGSTMKTDNELDQGPAGSTTFGSGVVARRAAARVTDVRRKISTPAPPTFQLSVLGEPPIDAQYGHGEQFDALTLHVPDIRRIASMTDLAKQSSAIPTVVKDSSDHSLARLACVEANLSDVSRSKSVDVQMHLLAKSRSGPGRKTSAHSYIGSQRALENTVQVSSNIPDSHLLRPEHAETGYKQPKSSELELKSYVDWTENAVSGEHLWTDTNVSIDFCYVGDADCHRKGGKKKCMACKIVVHQSCMEKFVQINFRCKPTFREAGLRNYRENGTIRHHWVHRRRQELKCKQCGKSFQQKFPFGAKEIIAISCSWCKTAYHNKVTCFMMQQIEEKCSLGVHASIIIPPNWIIKVPKKGSLKSSLRRKSIKGPIALKRKRSKKEHMTFMIKPIPSPHTRPLLVFVNPKSGGNEGTRLLHKFYWLLNPRQVFDLSQSGPRKALELYSKVPNLRILACGGDGTVGWLLSTIDRLGITPCPPVAILPLGTGNDLARTLGWGGAYTDEPLSKILCSVEDGPIVQLDRWEIKVESNAEAALFYQGESSTSNTDDDTKALDKLPIEEFNNYFSLGADAQVALEFHESREANPEKFNSRIKNKMFYAGAGGKFLMKRTWRDLGDYIRLECDDQDLTEKFRHLRLHCLLFLNIPRYGAGCTPWSNPASQRTDDGLIEVIGFTAASLATVQVGGHGERICQCSKVRLTTFKTIPIQVDGEPCRLAPSIVTIRRRCQANMIQKSKRRTSTPINNDMSLSAPERLRLQVSVATMADYETMHYEKDRLKAKSVPLGIIVVDNDSDLEIVRMHINRLAKDAPAFSGFGRQTLSDKWCFLDSTTAERFFRIDPSQEQLHYVTDISSEDVYILDYALERCTPEAGDLGSVSGTSHPVGNAYSQPVSPSADSRLLPTTQGFSVGAASSSSLDNAPNMVVQTPKQFQESERNVFAFPAVASSLKDVMSATKEAVGVQLTSVSGSDPCRGPATNTSADSGVAKMKVEAEQQPQKTSPNAVVNLSASDSGIDDGVSATASLTETRQLERVFIDAAKRGDVNVIAGLQQDGFDLLVTDEDGLTCLHHAARFGHKDLVKYILDHAPKNMIDMRDRDKSQTALHKAAWNQRRMVCRLLVSAGASLTARDKQNMTPRMLALQAEDWELAAYLHSHEHVQLVSAETRETAV